MTGQGPRCYECGKPAAGQVHADIAPETRVHEIAGEPQGPVTAKWLCGRHLGAVARSAERLGLRVQPAMRGLL